MNNEKLRNVREELEITQNEMANKLGCNESAYSLWKLNKNTIPLYYLNKLSNEFNINIDYLVDFSKEININFNKVEIDKIELGKKIKKARKSFNYTQEKLANNLNTTYSVVSAYESGKNSVPTLFLIEISKTTKKSLN